MQPNPLRYSDYLDDGFGEVDENNKLHGRGIQIWSDGPILIGLWENGVRSTGNCIYIRSSGHFRVGETYIKDELRWMRCTEYRTDGT